MDNMTQGFLSGFNNEDEDELSVNEVPKLEVSFNSASTRESESQSKKIDLNIEATLRELMRNHPSGGLAASRGVASTTLLSAPENYFDRFSEDVELGTMFVQNLITDRGKSDAIAKSQDNPTDEAAQEEAFSIVKTMILEFLSKKTWNGVDRAIIAQLISNEIIGFSVIDPLWRDKSINEIAVDGPFSVKVEIAGKWHYVRSCKFRSQAHMEQLLEKLYQSVGKTLSRMTPRVKGRLHDNSRVFSVHKSIMPHGPSLNIRRHPERHWAPVDLVTRGSASAEMLTDVGNLIYKGCSYLVVGGASTGKTSMLNALTGFYRNDIRILTVEDSLELKPNPHKMVAPGLETIPPRPDRGDQGVTIRDLVQACLQMAPGVIIVGESTGGEAYDLCQALNTGHAGASTVHANTIREAIPRMLSLVGQGEVIQAEAALPLIAAAFDFIIFLERSPIDGTRKIVEVAEIPSYPEFDESKKPFLNPSTIWRIDRENSSWNKVNQISNDLIERRGLNLERNLSWEELQELSKV